MQTSTLQKLKYFVRPLHIGASLVLLSLCSLFLTDLLGLRDDGRVSVSESRKMLAESTAMQLSTLVGIDDEGAIDFVVAALVRRSTDIQTASLVRTNGVVQAKYGEESLLPNFASISTSSEISVPIFEDRKLWGELQLEFAPIQSAIKSALGVLFFAVSSLLAFTLLLNKAFIQLDPNRTVPSRVDTAFNLFAAGVIILDDQLRVIMANQAACDMGSCERESLLGTSLADWPWQVDANWEEPWVTTLDSGLTVSDQPARLVQSADVTRLIMVSCAPVGDEAQGARGVMVTLDDVSSIERKNNELGATLKELRASQVVINAKNKELERLATTDALTGISNRRVLMEKLAREFERAQNKQTQLSCIMTDIDHFKRVNDTYGHGVGDDVIRAVANTLDAACSEHQVVGRYGGEEFVLILPGVGAEQAAELGENLREAIVLLAAGDQLAVPKLSSSFGVADMTSDASDATALVDLADQALYAAKQGGRNRVCIYDEQWVSAEAGAAEHQIDPVRVDTPEQRLEELETLLKLRDWEIQTLHEYDDLTGVPMRALFLQSLEAELARATHAAEHVGVLLFELRDIDRLVVRFGYSATNALLVAVVERLQQGLRKTDLITNFGPEHSLSRITSNEFGILLSEIKDVEGVMIVVTRLKRLISQPFLLGDDKVDVGVNIGISVSPLGAGSAPELLSDANDARIRASAKPDTVSYEFSTATLNDQSHNDIGLDSDLHDASG